MTISCCTWALGEPEADVLTAIAQAGLRHIDHRPFDFRSAESRRLISDLELTPACMATGFGMPEGAALDAADAGARDAAIEHTRRALEYAHETGVRRAYLLPGEDRDVESLDRYGESVTGLAGVAAGYGIKLCIEHFPGKALATVRDTLDYIAKLGHDNLYLLFDIGHAQISKEDPAEAVVRAGDRLGYFHLDDNDGESDLHWALCDGVLTRDVLQRTLAALGRISYDGPVSLEMNSGLPDPLAAIESGFRLVRTL
ncbi:MAG: sugar phosphate isomerase/epimerase [Gemmatimonadetes bacterium]|nr:sugar phosphate isomerase/epimerase [Gemmatimonadota bacterium]MYD26039.1 sugar phosphate isomerase/epimerase [Gemmatimonadota bacterium]MYI99788.1 sugar phosphate isomerase/epimerase [Gemmatimonadota bacterium]